MELDVKNLSYGKVEGKESLELDLSSLDLVEDVQLESATGEAEITRIDEELLVEFQIDPKVKLVCDRCQEEFIFEPNLKFERAYTLRMVNEESDILPVSKNFTISIEEPIHEEITLSIPYKKLCKESCAGICAVCGTNLNNNKCKCNGKKS